MTDPLFVRALKRETVERHPVWMMRQAGRYLPGYREVRARTPFLEMCRTPELAAKVTLEPIERFDMDAAIIFADILLTADAMGIEVAFPNGGPKIVNPIESPAQVERIHMPDEAWTATVAKTLATVRAALPENKAVLGFSAAPFTLSAYMIEGGTSRDFAKARTFAAQHPKAFGALLDKVADALVPYLAAQAEAGASALQLFDTWAGMADPMLYRDYVIPSIQRVLAGLGADRPPMILFAGIGTGARLELAASTGVEGLSIDWTTDLGMAYERVGDHVALQGNLDPTALLADPDTITSRVHEMLANVPPGRGHLVNLGHGVLRQTPPDHVAAFVEAARSAPVPA